MSVGVKKARGERPSVPMAKSGYKRGGMVKGKVPMMKPDMDMDGMKNGGKAKKRR